MSVRDRSSLVVPCLWALSTSFVGLTMVGSRLADRKASEVTGPLATTPTARTKRIMLLNFFATIFPQIYLALGIPANGWRLPTWFRLFSISTPPPFGSLAVWRDTGLVLAVGSTAFYAWSLYTIARAGAFGYFQARQTPRVVDYGPYAIVRHPIYTGVALMPLGYALTLWNAAPLFVFAATAAWLVPKIPMEEAFIDDTSSGPAYRQYSLRVPHRLVPYLY